MRGAIVSVAMRSADERIRLTANPTVCSLCQLLRAFPLELRLILLEAKARALRLVGETVREIGILIGVFAPLDAFFLLHSEGGGPPASAVGAFMVAALLCIGLGIILEMEV